MEAIEVSAEFAVSPGRLYRAWLDGSQHGAMTGAAASVENWVGGRHSAWDGYIWGRNLELEPERRIVQSWSTSEFPFGSQESRLEILLEPSAQGTRLTLRHSQIPDGQGEMYRDGWEESYFRPMRAYFSAAMPGPAPVAAVAAVSKVVAPAKPAAGRASKKPTRKARRKVTKAVKKKVAKRAKGRKTRKVARKSTRKVARKSTRKAARKSTRKAAKKTSRKATKKTSRKATKKTSRKVKRARRR